MASMKDDCAHASASPSACLRAVTALAASSTTPYPRCSRRRSMAVLPAPGVPVRMYRFMAVPSINCCGPATGPGSCMSRHPSARTGICQVFFGMGPTVDPSDHGDVRWPRATGESLRVGGVGRSEGDGASLPDLPGGGSRYPAGVLAGVVPRRQGP